MSVNQERGWTVVGKYGVYYDSFSRTRRAAIQGHTGAMGITWKRARANGDRAVKAVLRWSQP